jgi:hypothetical protein
LRVIAFIIFIFFGFLHAEDISDPILEIHSRVFPLLVTYSNDYSQKANDSVVLAVLYSERYESEAESFKSKVLKNFGSSLKGRKLEVVLLSESAFPKFKSTLNAVYILTDSAGLSLVINELNKNSVITFAGTRLALTSRALFGLQITDKVSIVLNKTSFQSGKFSFDQSLMKRVIVNDE